MWLILLALLLYGVLFAIINGLLVMDRKYSYAEKAHVFIPLLLVGISVLFILQTDKFFLPTYDVAASLVILASGYIAFAWLWQHNLSLEKVYGMHTVPENNRAILQLQPKGDLVKLVEIFFQDLVAYTIVLTLSTHITSGFLPIVAFTGIVLIAHLPAVKYFGTIFGSYFLVMSTVLAPVGFFLLQYEQGLYYLFMLHAGMYLLLYGMIYILSKYLPEQNTLLRETKAARSDRSR